MKLDFETGFETCFEIGFEIGFENHFEMGFETGFKTSYCVSDVESCIWGSIQYKKCWSHSDQIHLVKATSWVKDISVCKRVHMEPTLPNSIAVAKKWSWRRRVKLEDNTVSKMHTIWESKDNWNGNWCRIFLPSAWKAKGCLIFSSSSFSWGHLSLVLFSFKIPPSSICSTASKFLIFLYL